MNLRPITKGGSVLAAAAAVLAVGAPSASAALSFTPASHNYGNVLVNATGSHTFALTATCTANVGPVCTSPPGGVHTTNLGVTGSNFSQGTTNCGLVLNASVGAPASCTVTVHFTPTTAGPSGGSLTAGLAASGNDITAALSGTGVTTLTPPGGGTQGVAGSKKRCKKKKRSAATAGKKCRKKK